MDKTTEASWSGSESQRREPMTDSYTCPTCGTQNYPPDEEKSYVMHQGRKLPLAPWKESAR